MIDRSSERGERAERRLRDEVVIWLTTIGRSGQPQASPVWFVWDGESFLVYSRPGSRKVRNIRAHPHVGPAAADAPEYVQKYRAGIARLGRDPRSFADAYSTPIRITPTRPRVW